MKTGVTKKEKGLKTAAASLFESEFKDIYWAQKALVAAIPEMVENATSKALKRALEEHLEDAKRKVDEIFAILGQEPDGGDEVLSDICKEAKELFEEGSWCYEGVTRITPSRRTLSSRRISPKEHVERSIRR